ncbi:sensor histidine kinase [Nonomuraea sp. NPDC059194]|uniref:sensor histidine kinase n=1 Tax=Nonomuraea sp. NPDC059194 TaxID=3346764 RepID=UPI003679B91B
MPRLRRALVAAAKLPLNAVTGLAALVLLIVAAPCLLLAPGLFRAAARRLARSDQGDLRLLGWLAVQCVFGLGGLAVVTAMFSTLEVILHLGPLPGSLAVTLTLSLAMLAIAALCVVAAALAGLAQARLSELVLHPATSLAQRVRDLSASRAAAVDAQAAELRRIERDLHDGAQARLISVRMNLGLARSTTDPAMSKELIEDAWESVGQALTDLRDLVRGIHPPVLADRGLAGAIQAAALLCPVPVTVEVDLPGRPEAPVESALYFAAAEALANVTKHSAAHTAWVRLSHVDGVLRLVVGDDGRGGADPEAGSGLRGIRHRLSAFDGTLTVRSPVGGHTELLMELPCVLSSPKI